ncbi:MAG: hypothetical protein WD118_01010 [Phycisphaeraceae bacterium]
MSAVGRTTRDRNKNTKKKKVMMMMMKPKPADEPPRRICGVAHLLACIALIAGCQTAPPPAAAPAAAWVDDDALEHLGDFAGLWLRSDSVEAFVTATPYPRVLALRQPGEASPLITDIAPYVGIRTAYLEPVQIDASYGPATQPARIRRLSDTEVEVRAEPDPDAKLQLSMIVALDAEPGVLTVRHRMENVSDAERTLHLWSLTCLRRTGRFVVPFGRDDRPYRTLTYFWWTPLPQPGIDMARRTLTLDMDAPLNGGAMKLGVHNDAGWVAYALGRQALVSFVPHDADAVYAEAGDNITLFQAEGDERTWGEMEQIGPATTIGPGEAATLDETFFLVTLGELPDEDADADAWRDAIEAALPNRE